MIAKDRADRIPSLDTICSFCAPAGSRQRGANLSGSALRFNHLVD
jgi:hypothetical protein